MNDIPGMAMLDDKWRAILNDLFRWIPRVHCAHTPPPQFAPSIANLRYLTFRFVAQIGVGGKC